MNRPIPKLRTRKPTGVIPWPIVLIKGEEKSGKSHQAAEFTGCEQTGQAYWLELGEDTADEYANVPGAAYLLIEHNGTYRDILGQIEAVHAETTRAAVAKEKPVVLVIDSGSMLWRMLVNWTNERARRSRTGQNALRQVPDAEVKPSMNLWNDAAERWQRVMYLVRTMPGIVVLLGPRQRGCGGRRKRRSDPAHEGLAGGSAQVFGLRCGGVGAYAPRGAAADHRCALVAVPGAARRAAEADA
ncbi:hypothetical protein ACOBQB_12705 [Streptomyces sp. G5(2025)]|uniref:hypothetical protein n=1 Tax=Streptomyces sp. G5(2025) TaxID=3406628 RepID=UPI003C1B982D